MCKKEWQWSVRVDAVGVAVDSALFLEILNQ